jgi:hypothetical protein
LILKVIEKEKLTGVEAARKRRQLSRVSKLFETVQE